ncbi:hypothetical protein AB205_0147750 [Aquarana catesbeiana]|uniref:C2H2-type domain-containing protein n=1 Tax=Aquarana catesbeiana TaxID=8400 RepID=A0A2G9RC91_AQUCT|nr:hypothetical protein AB205_0147750 [Aquarana catesbeiana]
MKDGCDVRNYSERHLLLSADCKSEDNVITQDPPGGNPNTQNIHHRPSCPETSMDPSDQGESSHQSHTMIVNIHVRSHTADRSTDPSNPEESSSPHEGDHRGDNLFSCSECGKCFTQKGALTRHQRIHMGELPYSCSECGKSFTQKGALVDHQISHTDHLVKHQRSHTGDCPYSCSECGKSYICKKDLIGHQIIPTGVRPFSYSECGKSLTRKGQLPVSVHPPLVIRLGTRSVFFLMPHVNANFMNLLICIKHRKSLTLKRNHVKQQRSHTIEHRYSCSECGKFFSKKENLNEHHRNHMGQEIFHLKKEALITRDFIRVSILIYVTKEALVDFQSTADRPRAPVKAQELCDQWKKWEEPSLLDTAWDACMCVGAREEERPRDRAEKIRVWPCLFR